MADLPARPDLDQLRHQAKDLLRAAQRGDPDAVARINAVSGGLILSSAQLALAREYGFASWARLKLEVERRDILNSRGADRAGADIDAISAPDSGGVPSGTAMDHAAVFGMTEVVDVLVAAGTKIHSLEMAAAAGDITGWPLARFTQQSRIRALVFAADHQRLDVIDQLIEAGTPVNEADA
jgi:hypothetical protein